ncbi:MAG: cyclic nucleotide-binding domain-containing protein [Vampirovibrionales bacterium]
MGRWVFCGRRYEAVGRVNRWCLGEVAMLTGEPHSATAIALEETACAVLSRQDLQCLIRQRPDIGVLIYKNLALGLSPKLRRSGAGRDPVGVGQRGMGGSGRLCCEALRRRLNSVGEAVIQPAEKRAANAGIEKSPSRCPVEHRGSGGIADVKCCQKVTQGVP